MRADRVEVSWDSSKNKWLVRIISGEEVIRRHADLPQNADKNAVSAAAMKIAQDEGYEAEPAALAVTA
ncbi:MAG TPA: hypothetical protein VFO34_12270 [Candidatus Acidoferrales bacterium]|nr:hypothetical protein [Candidatus Acidoferrales bacterium]